MQPKSNNLITQIQTHRLMKILIYFPYYKLRTAIIRPSREEILPNIMCTTVILTVLIGFEQPTINRRFNINSNHIIIILKHEFNHNTSIQLLST